MWEYLAEAIVDQDLVRFNYLLTISSSQEFEKINHLGQTLLHIAVIKNSNKICKLLITKMNSETINAIDNQGRTALAWAAYQGKKEICTLLLPFTNRESINIIDSYKCTVLSYAAHHGFNQVCKSIVPQMSTEAINSIDLEGHTALMRASIMGLNKVCKLIIPKMNNKAISSIDTKNNTALYWALVKNLDKVCISLIPKMDSKSISIINDFGRTTLHLAALKKSNNICKLLILKMNCKSLSIIDDFGRTALDLAISRNLNDVCKLLIPLMLVETIVASKIHDDENYESKSLLEYTEQHNQLSLYKMLFAKVHSSYQSAFGDIGETKTDIIESVKKSLFRLADFFIKSFANSNSEGSEQVEIKFEDFNKFKFYQQINRDLLESCINHLGQNGTSLLKKVDTYIAIKYFTIAGITQSISLPEDPASHVFSYLEFPSLLAINTYEANTVTTTGESSSDASLSG